MDSVNKNEDYSTLNSNPVPQYLLDLERETHIKTINPRMLSGQLQGRILSMVSKMIRPKKILEIGTFTAYASLCMAEGLIKGGSLDTIEVNPELKNLINKYVKKSPYKDQINLHFGDAMQIIDNLSGPYDLIFIDAGKDHYIDYYEKVLPILNKGGIILADNVLWSGKVIDDPQDETARSIHKFNRHVKMDGRTEVVMLPVRDGISIIRKSED